MTLRVCRTMLPLALAGLLVGCPSSQPPPACTKATAPTSGPGDAAGLFPAASGDTWAYAVVETSMGSTVRSFRSRVGVLAPTTFDGAAAQVLAEANLDVLGRAVRTYLAPGPGGLTVLGNDDADDALTRAVAPYQRLPFPMVPGATLVPFDCNGLATGEDLDGDGRPDPVDVRSVVRVVAVEPVTVPAGTFSATRVETQLDLTAHMTRGSPVTAAGLRREWYAPGVGLVRWHEEYSAAGQAATTIADLYAYAVGSGALDVTPRQPIVLGQPEGGQLPPGGWQTYDAAVTVGRPLVAAAFSTGPSVGLRCYGDTALTNPVGGGFSDYTLGRTSDGIVDCSLTPGATTFSFDADAGPAATGPVDYVAFVAPAPDAFDLTTEDVQVPLNAVTPGHVGTRGRSTYTVTGITPGASVTIATAGLTGAADLRVYADDAFALELRCTLWNSSVVGTPEACTFIAGGPTAWFGVESGPINRDGAAYLLLTWSGSSVNPPLLR
jgi:hypothetical protein